MIMQAIGAVAQVSQILASLSATSATSRAAGPDAEAANPAALVSLSAAGRAQLAAEADSTNQAVTLETSVGTREIDLDEYFAPKSGPVDLRSVPLLLPSRANVAALSEHVSSRMPDFLAQHGIPSAPSSIEVDQQGQFVLPADYPHKAAFLEALEADPAMERTLRTVNALASHVAGIERALSGQGGHAQIELNFLADARLMVMADGEALLRDEAA